MPRGSSNEAVRSLVDRALAGVKLLRSIGLFGQGGRNMTDEDRQIGLAGKVLVDKIDAQLLEVQKQGQVVGFVVALTMEGRFHRRNERSTTTYLLYSEDIARLISGLIDATTDADPA